MVAEMPNRSYGQACSLARALDLIGERWTFLILRELFAGPRRFKDLLVNLNGIGNNLLSQRLKKLKAFGLVEDTRLAPPISVLALKLTPLGRELESSLVHLAHWGLNFSQPKSKTEVWSPMWNHIAFKARFDEKIAVQRSGTINFNIGGYLHYLKIERGTLKTGEGLLSDADVSLSATSQYFIEWIEGRVPIEEAISQKWILIEGNLEKFFSLLEVFSGEG